MTGQIQPRHTAPLARPMMPMAPMTPAHSGMTYQDVMKFLTILWRYKWRIVLYSFGGLILGIVIFFLINRYRPSYVAYANIQVYPQRNKDITKIEEQTPDKDIQYQSRKTIEAYLQNPDFQSDLIKNETLRGTSWYGKEVASPGLFEFLSPTDLDGRFLRYFKKNFRAQAARENEFVIVSFRCFGSAGQRESRDILNEIVTTFALKWKSRAEAKIIESRGALVSQQKALKGILDNTQDGLDKIRQSYSFGNLTTTRFRDYMEEKLSNLENEATALESEITRLTSEVGFLETRSKTDYDDVVREQIERDPVSAQMRQRLNDYEVMLSSQLASFGENHRRVKEIRDARDQALSDLQSRQKEIGDITRKSAFILNDENMRSKKQELEARKQQLKDGREEYRKLGLARGEYEQQEAKRDEARKQYDEIGAQISKYDALLRPEANLSRIDISKAQEPREKDSPKVLFYVIGFTILGLFAGLSTVFIIELRNTGLRLRISDFRRLGVPLLGRICHEEADDETQGVDLFHVVRQAPYSMMSDDYRQFRMNLRQLESAANKKILLFTSPTSGDGKTTVAANLASVLLLEGRKVLFIDANFRKSASATVYPLSGGAEKKFADFGLGNYLMGQCSDPREIVRRSGIEGLDVIDGVPIPPKPANPAEILGSPAMRKLLDTFRDSYDYILLDGPPTLVSDALTLAALAEGTIVVFNASSVKKGQAERILSELNNIQATVLGTVLLGVKKVEGGYFQERYLAYQQYQKTESPLAKAAN